MRVAQLRSKEINATEPNPKALITRPDRYEPGVSRMAQDCARHYGTAILPARPYHPQDKAKFFPGDFAVIDNGERHTTIAGIIPLNQPLHGLVIGNLPPKLAFLDVPSQKILAPLGEKIEGSLRVFYAPLDKLLHDISQGPSRCVPTHCSVKSTR